MNLDPLTLFLLLALGFIPWRVSRRTLGRRPRLHTRWQFDALFWRLTVTRTRGRRQADLRLTIPLIQRLAAAVWAALRSLVA